MTLRNTSFKKLTALLCWFSLHGQTFLPGLASPTIESHNYELCGPGAGEVIATIAPMQLVCSNAERGSEILQAGSWTTSATVTLNRYCPLRGVGRNVTTLIAAAAVNATVFQAAAGYTTFAGATINTSIFTSEAATASNTNISLSGGAITAESHGGIAARPLTIWISTASTTRSNT